MLEKSQLLSEKQYQIVGSKGSKKVLQNAHNSKTVYAQLKISIVWKCATRKIRLLQCRQTEHSWDARRCKFLARICRASRQSELAYRSCAYSVSGSGVCSVCLFINGGRSSDTAIVVDHDPIILSDQMIEYVKSKCYSMIALALDV